MSNNRRTIRWGILATGGIAKTFAKDLSVDPKTRNVDSIAHEVVAAASSSGKSRAETFLKEVIAPPGSKAYGSYEELVQDHDIDVIYIGTPHSHHFQNAMLCLQAGKNVLCEKPLTVNAAQTKLLIEKAKEKNVFFMHAVWTRYFPLSIYVRELISSGRIGTIHRTIADLSFIDPPEKNYADGKHRMVNPDLAGGCLLDLGVYSLTWVFQTLYHTQPESNRKPPSVLAAVNKYEATGVDEKTTVLLSFPRDAADGGSLHGIAMTSFRAAADPDKKGTAGPAVRIQGDKGEIQVFAPIFRPTHTKLISTDGSIEEKEWRQPGPGRGSGWKNGFGDTMGEEGEGHGMFWEADEVGFALCEGRKEGKYEGLDESLLLMNVMDEIRRQGNVRFPDKIESTDYPITL